MLGFRVVIDEQGQVVNIELPAGEIPVKIRQRDCERAKVVFPKGHNVRGRQQPVLWCMDERLAQAIAQACLRAWLALP